MDVSKISIVKQMTRDLIYRAATQGDMNYLAAHRDLWDAKTCMYAARNGHHLCLQYLHENGCTWNAKTCEEAAANGHLKVLEYAVRNGCVFQCHTFLLAAIGGHLQCLQFIHEYFKNRPTSTISYHQSCVFAIENGHIECLKYILSLGTNFNINSMLWAAAAYGQLECFRYLYDINCSLNTPTSGDEWWENHTSVEYDDKYTWKVHQIWDQIDLDDGWWRTKLFHLRLDKHPYLLQRIKEKKQEIQAQEASCADVLSSVLPIDVLRYILVSYF